MNCCLPFFLMVGLGGVTAIETSAAVAAASRACGLVTDPTVAATSAKPLAATAVARPPGELMVATVVSDDAQAAEAVRLGSARQ